MAYSQAQNKATQKYSSKAYDQIKVLVKKGERENIKSHAETYGESLNGFIKRAIDETIERDNLNSEQE